MKIDPTAAKGALGFTADPDGDILDQLLISKPQEGAQPRQVPPATPPVVNLDRF
jgi:predicted house-cleaning noncanonical NTP pyrophosphatase (MazG superfamily)